MKKTFLKASQKSENKSVTEALIFLRCMLVHMLLFALASVILLLTDADSDMYFLLGCLTFALAGFSSGFVAGRYKRKNGLVNGIVYSLPSIALLSFASLYLNGFDFNFALFVNVLSVLFFSAAGGIVSVNVRKKTKIKR